MNVTQIDMVQKLNLCIHLITNILGLCNNVLHYIYIVTFVSEILIYVIQ